MKKMMVVFSLAILVTLLVTSNIMAYPFIEVEGYVDPYAGNVIKNIDDGTTTFTKIDYTFNVTDSGAGSGMYYLQLRFKNNVFDVDSMGDISYLNDGWNANHYSSGNSFYQQTSVFSNGKLFGFNVTGSKVGAGDMLAFSMLNVDVFDDAISDPWSQHWAAAGSHKSFFGFPILSSISGGSTTHTPEPGTFLLLGTGIAGVVIYVRKKKCLLSI